MYTLNDNNPNQGIQDGDWVRYFLLDQNNEEFCILIKDDGNGMEVVFNLDNKNDFPKDSDLEYNKNNERIVSLYNWFQENEEEFC